MCSELKSKDKKLSEIRTKLKETFIGIDAVIDKFIDAIRIWYLMPELMTRPVIVNLWGLTGTGKTTLVREFVKLANFNDSFVEVQMDENNNGYSKSIKSHIERAGIETNAPSILLLDEIQRFRTVDSTGMDVETKQFPDVWMLLSDGKFQTTTENKSEITALLLDDEYNEEHREKTGEPTILMKYKMDEWNARRIKTLIKSNETVQDIMKWTKEYKYEILRKALVDAQTYEGTSYSKMLIIISGNIDDAYDMSKDVSDNDIDADVLHEFSKKINVISIKNALTKRFKPEQIARFGNNHIIYPCLSKYDYQTIIKRTIEKFVDNIQRVRGIKINVDDNVYRTIYNNGVFPSQGVRPVISTISSIFENYIPIFVLKAIETCNSRISITYDDLNIIGQIGDEITRVPVDLAINKIKLLTNMQERIAVSVHEAGHALVYSIIYKIAPTQIKSSTASESTSGFVGTHKIHMNKINMEKSIAITLAGKIAERIVFGDEYQTISASADIMYATKLASSYVRTYGFDIFNGKITSEADQFSSIMNTDISKTNGIIEKMLEKGKEEAQNLINANSEYFKGIIQKLMDDGELSPRGLCEIAKKHGIEISICLPENKIVSNYEQKLNEYLHRT